MVIKSAELEIVCGITSKLPDTVYPEVAFAGKSNVGKSSLINSLVKRKALARTSAQPGKTQTINFYKINKGLYFVDLPGYGYASASVETRAAWGKMIERYLHTSKQLRYVFLLIDIRHTPSENDRIMYDWICDQGYEPIIIATKLDKINRSQIQKNVSVIRKTLNCVPGTRIIPFSSETKQGIEEIYSIISEVMQESIAEGQDIAEIPFEEENPSEKKAIEKKAIEKKAIEKKVIEKKPIEKKVIEKKPIEKKSAEKKTAVKKATEKKQDVKKLPAKKVTAKKAIEKKSVAKKTAAPKHGGRR